MLIAMKRLKMIAALLFVGLFLICAGFGCTREKLRSRTFTVGVINLNKELDKVFQGFKQGLAVKGYEEGKNITYLYSGAHTNLSELEKELKGMTEQPVDLILSITTPATIKAKQLTAGLDIPVVFAPVFDPVGSGIVQSLVRPGGNITGIKVGGGSGKALEWLLKIAPETKRIYIPFSSNNRATVQSLRDVKIAADKLKVQLSIREVNNKKELIAAFEQFPDDVDAIWLLNSHFLVQNTALYVETAIRKKLPLGSSTFQVDDGVLIAYGQNAFRTGEMAAALAYDIFQGTSPRDLPVENTDFFLGINLKTAQAIGVDISEDILHVADTIIRP